MDVKSILSKNLERGNGIKDLRCETGRYSTFWLGKGQVRLAFETCSVRVVEIHQLACPPRDAQEVKTDENGNQHCH